MKVVRDISVHEQSVIAATSGGVFVHGPQGITRYTNVDGLSDIDYTAGAVMPDGRIVLGVSTGMINIQTESGGWTEVSDIVRATQFTKRGITQLLVRDDLLYVATEFGLAVYNLKKQEFGDTYTKFGDMPALTRVTSVLILENTIWVTTEDGVASADLLSPNLKDPENWTSYSNAGTLDMTGIVAIASFDAKIVAASENDLFVFDGAAWDVFETDLNIGPIVRLLAEGENLLLLSERVLLRFRPDRTREQIGDRADHRDYPRGLRFSDIKLFDDGRIVLGTSRGIAWMDGDRWQFVVPNGPGSNFFRDFAVDEHGTLWAASSRGNQGQGLYSFDGDEWTNYMAESHSEILNNLVTGVTPGANNSMWFSTRGHGVFERLADGTVSYHNSTTVPGFPGIPNDQNYAAVEAVESDGAGNIWSLHFSSSGPLLGCRTTEGAWYFFTEPSLAPGAAVLDMAIDMYGRKWMIIRSGFTGIIIFDDNGTIGNYFDDTWKRMTASDPNGINATSQVTSIAVDMLGDVWIGTDRGLRTIFNPRFNDRVSTTCFNIRCNVEGLYIAALAVDPVNNKWLGTKDGVFVLSPDGGDIIATYTKENSPLLDNEIQAIFIHPNTGVAYIATQRGLSSLSTPYVKPAEQAGELRVYPNPFRPGIDDRVVIDGLLEASIIKILSVSGSVVAEFDSPGGRIGFWDGKTSDGEYAATGVYFVVGARPRGGQTVVAKIAVIRE